ncbi:MAG: Bifunctional NAD(P)H-hydrate repair enzyme Nnr [Candidatus Anoxychlamydiales bacterium]|nr:Bifunctional NAD(P)H-hydrate repair enzyme Nnr [Candidatus Anoxychlamydiales bacterium]HEU64113.1 NAD(P)H-hydrate dehydratase [Chlamydiota bacterium]
MRVVSAIEMARVEALAYLDGISDEMYMQNAGLGIFQILTKLIREKKLPNKITIIAGKGNNAGDGYVVAKSLLEKGYDVKIFQLFPIDEASKLLKLQYDNFIKKNGKVTFVKNVDDIVFENENENEKEKNTFILDAILGTGFKGALSGFLLDAVNKINEKSKELNLKILSIDIPSGLNGNTGIVDPTAIRSDITIYLGLAKLGFFINDGPNYIGNLVYVDFGLDEKYKKLAKIELEYMDKINLKNLLPKIDRKRHKYEAGFVIGIAGSEGMYGAAKLSSLAALRSGCGIVKMITQKAVPSAFYELVNFVIDFENIEEILALISKADSVFIGPGLGRDKKVEDFLFKILPKINKKTILDADALFHLANNLKMILPKDSVLTPHKNEMKRLLRIEKPITDEKLFEKTKKFSVEKNVGIVLKGYPTIIFHPKKDPITILGGDPGLATAGTGDVLTGMIASFAAQKLDLFDASILAVHLHFKASEIAALEKTSYSLIATDVIDNLSQAFKKIL